MYGSRADIFLFKMSWAREQALRFFDYNKMMKSKLLPYSYIKIKKKKKK